MKNLFGELTVQEAAEELNIDCSTLNKWLQRGFAPFSWRGRRRYVSQTVVDKISVALSKHGSQWYRHVEFTPFDRLENKTVPLDRLVQSLDKNPENPKVDPSNLETSDFKVLAGIAKKLKEMNQMELAAVVSLKAVELI